MNLISTNQVDIQLTSGCRNDQQDSKESSNNIEDNALLIRDLGYITTTYLQAVIKQNALFLNRLPSQMFVYNCNQGNIKVGFNKLYKKMKRYNLPFIELNILAGKSAQIPCRLIVYLNDEKTMRHQLRKTQRNTISKGGKVSKENKTRAKLGIYITNVAKKVIKAQNVKPIYSLRWQIELVFKTWKPLCKIDKVKKVKIHRFEPMLLAGLIWIMVNWKVFQLMNKWFDEHIIDKTCSLWKFFKHAVKHNLSLRSIVFGNKSQCRLVKLLVTARQLAGYH